MLSRQVGIDGTGVDNQAFIELRAREILGLGFGLECFGGPGASSFGEDTALFCLKRDVPGMRHRSPKTDAPRRSCKPASRGENKRCLWSPTYKKDEGPGELG